MKNPGLKIGFAFFVLSILLTLTIVGPIFIPVFAEGIGTSIDKLFKVGNVGGTTFYTCVIICCLCLVAYILTVWKFRKHSKMALTLFFLSIFIFLNAALFYYDIRLPNSRIDGQQAMNSIDKPIKTCLLYLVFGVVHDMIPNVKNGRGNTSNEKSVA